MTDIEPHTITAEEMAAIPEIHRAPLAKLADGLTYRQIASDLGLKIGTVRSRINRGRAAVAKARARRANQEEVIDAG